MAFCAEESPRRDVGAGAVVSGAYFGDKLSPLSDTTNMSSLAAGANLYEHIRHMLYTALPSSVLAVVVFLVAGTSITTSSADLGGVEEVIAIDMAAVGNRGTLVTPHLVDHLKHPETGEIVYPDLPQAQNNDFFKFTVDRMEAVDPKCIGPLEIDAAHFAFRGVDDADDKAPLSGIRHADLKDSQRNRG